MSEHRWIVPPPRARREPALRLYCFHHAGGSAASFAAWHRALPEQIEVHALQLPRAYLMEPALAEAMRRATPREQLDAWIAALCDALGETLPDAMPFAFYGHSLGALIAYELTCALRRMGMPQPAALCVSGRRAPACALRGAPLCDLDDATFVPWLARMGGVPTAFLENEKWRATFLPTMRDDLRVSDLYTPRGEPPLALPLFAFRGLRDPILEADEFAAWRAITLGPSTVRVLSGAHFFDDEGLAALHRHLADDLDGVLAAMKETDR